MKFVVEQNVYWLVYVKSDGPDTVNNQTTYIGIEAGKKDFPIRAELKNRIKNAITVFVQSFGI
jgi:hypothetical protein